MAEQAQTWLALKQRQLDPCGLRVVPEMLPIGAPTDALVTVVARLSADDSVDGIFMQYPFADSAGAATAARGIPAAKDVDGAGFDPLTWSPGMSAPATPLATTRLLAQLAPNGPVLVVCGPGPFGPVLTSLLRSEGRDVVALDASSAELNRALAMARIVIAASGASDSIDGARIAKGAVVIDTGYDLPGKAGEVNLASTDISAWKAFVPPRGGLGPLTVLTLGEATLRAAKRRVAE